MTSLLKKCIFLLWSTKCFSLLRREKNSLSLLLLKIIFNFFIYLLIFLTTFFSFIYMSNSRYLKLRYYFKYSSIARLIFTRLVPLFFASIYRVRSLQFHLEYELRPTLKSIATKHAHKS